MSRTRVLLAVAASGLVTSACAYTLPDVAPEAFEEAETSTVYAADGSVLALLHAEENRHSVALAEVPVQVRLAVLAAEDARFYAHRGVDIQALLRAARANVTAGEISEGGSTITQQYVKIAVLEDAERSLERKIREALCWRWVSSVATAILFNLVSWITGGIEVTTREQRAGSR